MVAELEETTPFLFTGFAWGAELGPRLVIVGFTVLIMLAASLPFDRFDTSRKTRRWVWQARKVAREQVNHQTISVKSQSEAAGDRTAAVPAVAADQLSTVKLADNSLQVLGEMVLAELKLMLKGRLVLWYCAVFGLVIATLTAPLPTASQWLLPGLWLMPITIWSE